jgi:dienelactone hydrolase
MKRLSGFVGITLFFIIFATTAQAKLVSNEVSYQLDGKEFKGYLAYDEAIKGKRPGVLVVHEWWGHTEFARERARALARMGYVAFSLDMYGDGKTADHPKDAGRFSGQVKSNMAAAQARFLAAREQLLASKVTDQDKIAAIGY